MRPDLTVVIPAFNEVSRIQPTLDRIVEYFVGRQTSFEVLVVDDGSSDGTAAVIEERFGSPSGGAVRVLIQPTNQGKGAALRRGVLASQGAQVLLCDADLSVPIEDIERLEARLDDDHAIAIGSRAVAESEISEHQPLYRELMGKTFNLLVRLFGVGGFSDTQCGFKLLEGRVAREIFALVLTDGFAFDVEMLWLARRRGDGVYEVGVRWANSLDSRVSPVKDSIRMLRDILAMRWRHARRRAAER